MGITAGVPGICGQSPELWISGQEAALVEIELLEDVLLDELLESDLTVLAALSLLPESLLLDELLESDFDESLELLPAAVLDDAERLSLR